MVKRIGTSRRKTRHIFKKSASKKGKISLRNFFQVLESGEKVVLKCEPAYHKGMYFRRFHGKVGIITGMQGKCYKISIKDFNKEKTLLVHPVHLKRA
jgi:large subunit ribosomal protein L21e